MTGALYLRTIQKPWTIGYISVPEPDPEERPVLEVAPLNLVHMMPFHW